MKFIYKTLCLAFVQALSLPVFAQLPELDWHKTFSPAEPGARMIVTGLQTSIDGNFVIYGQITGSMDLDPGPGATIMNPADGHALFAKFNQRGELLWARTLPMSIHTWKLNPETGWIVYNAQFSGSFDFDPGPGSHVLNGVSGSMALVKLDDNGNFRGATDIRLRYGVSDLAVDGQGRVLVAGFFSEKMDFNQSPTTVTLSPAGNDDGFVALYDNSLNIQQAFRIGGIDADYATTISLTADGFAVGGRFGRNTNFDPAGGTQTLNPNPAAGFVATYTLDANGIAFKSAFAMGDRVTEVKGDQRSNMLSVSGWIKDSVDVDPGPGVSQLYAIGRQDVFVSHMKADGSFGFGRAFGTGTSRPTANTTASPFGGVFYAGSMYKPLDLNTGQATGQLTPLGDADLFVSKFQDDGSMRYGFGIGAVGATTTCDAAVSSNGAIVLTGRTSGTIDLDPGTGVAQISPTSQDVTFLARYKDESTLGVAPHKTGGTVKIHSSARAAIIDFSDCQSVNALITVSDLSGRNILTTDHRTADMRRINLGDIAAGFYLITVRNGATKITEKIAVQ